ncbi:MAG: GIY-YIG nuclease family protein [Gallionella sp.]|nr:GIY-YIG nuclease family protein [Gallionella sp.]
MKWGNPVILRQAQDERIFLSIDFSVHAEPFGKLRRALSKHKKTFCKRPEMFWVYILRCADGSYYTGHTDDLERRIAQHQIGEWEGYTASRRPVALAWSQEFVTREEALSAERQIKGWSRKKKEAMMCGDWPEVARLGRHKTASPSTGSG